MPQRLREMAAVDQDDRREQREREQDRVPARHPDRQRARRGNVVQQGLASLGRRSHKWLYTTSHTTTTKMVITVTAASRSGDSASASSQDELVMTP